MHTHNTSAIAFSQPTPLVVARRVLPPGALQPLTTWAQIIEADPRIGAVIFAACRCRRLSLRRRWAAYSRAKQTLARFVGWYAKDPRLSSSDAYDAVIDRLVDAQRI